MFKLAVAQLAGLLRAYPRTSADTLGSRPTLMTDPLAVPLAQKRPRKVKKKSEGVVSVASSLPGSRSDVTMTFPRRDATKVGERLDGISKVKEFNKLYDRLKPSARSCTLMSCCQAARPCSKRLLNA